MHRTEAERYAYEIWKLSEAKEDILHFLSQSYQFFLEKQMSEKESEIVFMQNVRNSGFVLTFNSKKHKTIEFQYFFDYLREKVGAEGYSNYLSDRKQQQRKKYTEITERHYLKARFNFDEQTQKFQQHYGNITIEFVKRNEKAIKIKLLCVPHHDRSWEAALPFEDLMVLIVS